MNIEQAKEFMNKLCKDWDVEGRVAPWFRELAARELVGLVSRPTQRALDGAKPAVTLSGFYNCEVCGQEKVFQPGVCEDCSTPPTEDEIKTWRIEETPRK